MNRKNLLLIAIALLLVVLGNWLTEEGVKQVDKHLTPPAAMQKGYYLNELVITALNEDGQPQHRLQAKQLNYFDDVEQTELHQPRIELYEQGKVAWHVNAKRGLLSQKNDEVRLQGNVKLKQSGNTEPLQLTTSVLRIQPKQGRADTDQPVTLIQANNRIDAVGMMIEQHDQRLILLSKVRGYYEELVH